MTYKIGQVGYGFVGKALHDSFKKRGITTIVYDKYLDSFETELEDLKECTHIFLCLPTPYVAGHGFDLGPIKETCKRLEEINWSGSIIIKSTTEPGVTQKLANTYERLLFFHNPEFLTARTAFKDFDNQKHIVVGYTRLFNSKFTLKPSAETIGNIYKELYPDAKISICTAEESESMKLFVNNFYAMKVQIFNEFYFLCQKTGADYHKVKEMMLENGWINPMHTNVPGPDGNPSFGGMCFPKDTNALLHFMKTLGSPHKVLEATVEERNNMREEKWK